MIFFYRLPCYASVKLVRSVIKIMSWKFVKQVVTKLASELWNYSRIALSSFNMCCDKFYKFLSNFFYRSFDEIISYAPNFLIKKQSTWGLWWGAVDNDTRFILYSLNDDLTSQNASACLSLLNTHKSATIFIGL